MRHRVDLRVSWESCTHAKLRQRGAEPFIIRSEDTRGMQAPALTFRVVEPVFLMLGAHLLGAVDERHIEYDDGPGASC